jgi:hypothetical protein
VDNGITGLKVTKVNGAVTAALAEGYQSAYAFCPTGSVLVGGGAAIVSGQTVTHLIANQPGGATNWYAQTYELFGSGGTSQTQAYALCLSIESGGPITTAKAGRASKASTATR